MKPGAFLGVVLAAVTGCGAPAADHERLADQAYREGNYVKAVGEYQAAQRSGARSRVWAKVAAAAIKAQEFATAVDAFAALAREDPTRTTEAALGLEQVARVAERQGPSGVPIVAQAVLALRRVAPGRPLGRLPLPLISGTIDAGEALGIIPTAIATAGSPRTVDSLLLRYAAAQRETVACDGAFGTFRTVVRRSTDGRLVATAREGLATCALLLGSDALARQDGATAERWFEEVLAQGGESVRSWTASLGLGDARLLKGDALGAAVAYQVVVAASAAPDSLRQAAVIKLNGLGAATVPPPGGDT
ncbi:MAG: hypothetical protein ACKVZ0_11175 [Gemmatimonadales bacterium]